VRSIESIARTPQESPENRGETARRLLRELLPYRRSLSVGLALVALGALTQALGPWIIGRTIDQEILGGDPQGLLGMMALLLVVYVAGTLAQRGQIRQVGSVGQRILASLRERIFGRLLRLPLGFFDRRPVGDLMSRVTNDVDTLNQLFSQGLSQLLGSLFSLVGIVVAMAILDWRLALVCFAIVPVMLLTNVFFAHRARRAFRTTRETVGDVTAGLQEEIVGIREAQAFDRTATNIARFRERNAANRSANLQAVAITSAFAPTIDVLSTLSTAVVIGFGGYLVVAGNLTVGILTAFLIYVQQFFRPIQLASQVYTQAQAALAGAERIYAVLDEPAEPADPPGSLKVGDVEGRIEFDRVTFAYEPGRPVLHEVSFTAEPGKTVALVGPTGAGKTTIANLIPRFYDATGGAVRLDGRDVRELERQSLREKIATVLQEPFLFSGTVAENIAYGREGASREEVEAAARAVSAHGFIRALPQGYDTHLGSGASSLSGGQRQLVSFARAVLAGPRILILDEATSNVDTRTERLIQGALPELLRDRTSVVIAHRLSTIRNADLILVIENGRVAERGAHGSLLAAGGRYADLYRRQFSEPTTHR
jgi:ATP-binding cassette, subfamily B, multidrug efflux pump